MLFTERSYANFHRDSYHNLELYKTIDDCVEVCARPGVAGWTAGTRRDSCPGTVPAEISARRWRTRRPLVTRSPRNIRTNYETLPDNVVLGTAGPHDSAMQLQNNIVRTLNILRKYFFQLSKGRLVYLNNNNGMAEHSKLRLSQMWRNLINNVDKISTLKRKC